MKYVVMAAGVLACVGCFDAEEFAPVSVPVYDHCSTAELRSADVRATDPCGSPAPDISTCTPIATVRTSNILTQPSCYLDTTFHAGESGRVLQCAGGRAVVVFEKAIFSGDLAGGDRHSCKTTSYDFPQGDSCTWRTEQRISGSMQNGVLAFSYAESPVAGRDCTLACSARASLDLLSE